MISNGWSMVMAKLVSPIPRLTPRQETVLTFVFDTFKARQFYPTLLDIKNHLGSKSNNTGALVAPLFKKGYLQRLHGRGNYEITERGIDFLRGAGTTIPTDLLEHNTQLDLKTV